MRALSILLLSILVSCGIQTPTQRAEIGPEDAIVTIKSRCVDTMRIIERTPDIPPRFFYRDVAYVFQLQPEIDLRVSELYGDSTLAIVALTPDDSLSLYIVRWREAIDISPTTATFSFLVKTLEKGTAYLKVAHPRETRFIKKEIRATGTAVKL